jgi:hypothetical protein
MISTATHTPQPVWRANGRGQTNNVPAQLASGNGTTTYGEIQAGTLLAEHSGGLYHPAGDQPASAGATGVAFACLDATNFYAGDSVRVYSSTDVYDTVAGTVVGGAGATIDVTALAPGDSTLRFVLVDPGAASQGISLEIMDDGTTRDLRVMLETDGAGTIISLVSDVIAYLSGSGEVLAELASGALGETAIAVAATALTGGREQYDDLGSTARTVATVDKTSTPNVVTFGGANVTYITGDRLVKVGLHLPAGVLDHDETTLRYDGTTAITMQPVTDLAVEGDARTSYLIGYHSGLARALRSGVYTDALGTEHVITIPGFDILAQ